MKLSKLLVVFLAFSLVWGGASPALAQSGSQPVPNSPEAVPILVCNGNGSGGDLADTRGIQFTVSQNFSAVEARFKGTVAGNYHFAAELRRSNGFTTDPIGTVSVSAQLPEGVQTTPYMPVRFDFGPITVSGTETFTVKFINFDAPGTAYLEVFGIGTKPCPNVQETDENNVANPTERSDPAGFKVLAPDPNSFALNSIWATTPPNIDGSLGFGEWNYGANLPFDNGFISVVNDDLRLYVLLDATGETINNLGSDYFFLTFDVNRDANITPNVDINYGVEPRTNNIRYQFYVGPAQWTGLQPTTYSSRGNGFGCFFPDGSLSFVSISPFRLSCNSHRVWELAIDLAEIGAHAGDTVRMGARIASPNPSFSNAIPADFETNFSNLINVHLANSPYFTVAPFPGAKVVFTANPLEVTQAVQSTTNSVSLVANKATSVRVNAITANVAFPMLAKIYLYGRQGAVDLPGSPQVKWQSAPTIITRTNLNQTANFALPKTWTTGSVIFSSRSVDQLNNKASTADIPIAYTGKAALNVWVVPINTGTNNAPILPPQSEINLQESYMKTIYPQATINFTQKSWTVLGPVTGEPITALNNYYNSVVLAWLFSVIFTGKEPFTLPDQIYGLTPSGGGLSDPVWAGGAGRVARGNRGTSLEGTMAHEINHNLDRSGNGTWGRHVNPGGTGCGAAGPDPNWPFINPNVNEVGFDTRLPWSASGSILTVIPAGTPDIMSYCQSGLTSPTKWISAYRWNNLFNNFSTVLAAQALKPTATTYPTVYYITGQVNKDGTGSLNPILTQPGMPSTDIPKGDYSLEIQDTQGNALSTTPFKVEFLDDPEEPVNSVYINYQIPVPVQPGQAPLAVGKVVLKHGADVLDEIVASAHAPTVTITNPAGGETWSGVQTLQWTGADQDGDALTYTVLYSPDGGANWISVASNVTASSLPVDTSVLPGGDQAMFRVIASDGINNGQGDSNKFKIANNPPKVIITSPVNGSVVKPGDAVQLTGDAVDAQDTNLPEEAFFWTEGNNNLGTGREIGATLAPGPHTITLTVVNSTDNSGSATVDVLVGSRNYLPTIQKP